MRKFLVAATLASSTLITGCAGLDPEAIQGLSGIASQVMQQRAEMRQQRDQLRLQQQQMEMQRMQMMQYQRVARTRY